MAKAATGLFLPVCSPHLTLAHNGCMLIEKVTKTARKASTKTAKKDGEGELSTAYAAPYFGLIIVNSLRSQAKASCKRVPDIHEPAYEDLS